MENRSKNSRFISEEIKKEMISLYLSGLSTLAIKRKLNLKNCESISCVLKKNNIPRRGRKGNGKTSGKEIEIISLYNSGKTMVEIGKYLRLSHRTVGRTINKIGGSVRTRDKYSPLFGKEQEIIHLYESGKTLKEIGSTFGVTGSMITHFFKRKGIKARDSRITKGQFSKEKHPFWKGGLSVNNITEWRRIYQKLKRKNDPLFNLKCILRARIKSFFDRAKKYNKEKFIKDTKTVNLLGADFETVFKHIESQFRDGMTWKNHGSVWVLDHCRPLAMARDRDELLLLFHWKNLQPLLKKENGKKGAKYNGVDYRKYRSKTPIVKEGSNSSCQ